LENQETTIEAPRDRSGTFEPIIAPKRRKHPPLFNDQIISMRGAGDRKIDEGAAEPAFVETYTIARASG
jgi:transposase-like protein